MMALFRQVGISTLAFIVIESAIIVIGQFTGSPLAIGAVALMLVLAVLAQLVTLPRQLRRAVGAPTYGTGRGLAAIGLSLAIAAGTSMASALIAITVSAALGGRL
jgi:hypothetical protein